MIIEPPTPVAKRNPSAARPQPATGSKLCKDAVRSSTFYDMIVELAEAIPARYEYPEKYEDLSQE